MKGFKTYRARQHEEITVKFERITQSFQKNITGKNFVNSLNSRVEIVKYRNSQLEFQKRVPRMQDKEIEKYISDAKKHG